MTRDVMLKLAGLAPPIAPAAGPGPRSGVLTGHSAPAGSGAIPPEGSSGRAAPGMVAPSDSRSSGGDGVSLSPAGKEVLRNAEKPDFYVGLTEEYRKRMEETQRKLMEQQMFQAGVQQQQVLFQTQMQIQKSRNELLLAFLEHQKTLQNMVRATLAKLHQMEMEMRMAEHANHMRIGEGWLKALSGRQ